MDKGGVGGKIIKKEHSRFTSKQEDYNCLYEARCNHFITARLVNGKIIG